MRCRPLELFALAAISNAGGPCQALAANPLETTRLYVQTAKACRTVDLSNWSHATVQVLKQENVALIKVELCNNGKYPVYTVHFKYDPRGDTTAYFHPLYERMASANGFWPLSFVDIGDNVIVDLVIMPLHQIDVAYEDFSTNAVIPAAR